MNASLETPFVSFSVVTICSALFIFPFFLCLFQQTLLLTHSHACHVVTKEVAYNKKTTKVKIS